MSDRVSNLSPAKRRFLLEKLREQAAERGVVPSEQAPALEAVPRDGELPLSFSQQRLWFLDQFEPGGSFYNIPAAYRLRGALDRPALVRSLDEIVRRHEALRTSFGTMDGRPVQRIAPAAPVRLHVIDLAGVPETEREARALEAGVAEARHGFDMANGPLFRVTLIVLSPAEHLLILNMHHIISDGWSIGVLTTELSALYRAFVAGEPSPLPELQIQYADFAAWQHRLLQGEALERQTGYWRRHLEGAPATSELPTDRPRPAVQRFRGLTYSFALSARLSRALREVTRREEATLFMTLLAAFKTLVLRFTGQEDLVVGAGIANRTRIETEPLIGFFVNTLAVRTSLAGNPTFRELLHRVRDAALGAYAHQDLPFEKLVEELRPQRDLSRNPLVQLAFVLQNAPMPPLALPSLTLEPVDLEVASAKFDWLLSMWDTEPEITGSLELNSDLFDLETVERMIGGYTELLEAFAADPGLRLRMAPLFTAETAASLGLAAERVEAVAPLTPTQRDLYLDHVLSPESVTYSLGVSARLGTEVDPALWQAAVAAVVEREPMTRARFTEHRGQPVQVIEKDGAAPCEVLALDDPSEEAFAALVREKVKVRYRLREGGLFRGFLVRGLPGGDIALLAFHHIVADAFSGRLLLERIAAAYEALAAGREPALPPALTFLDDVGESLARFDTPETERFWVGRLAGVAPLELYSGVDRPSQPSRRRAVLAGDDLARLDRFCADRGLSRAAVLRGLFGALLDRLFSPPGDLLVYDVVGGRPREHAATIGCFYQVVPVVFGRDRLQPETAIDGWLAALRNDRRELGARQNLSVLLGKRLVRGEKLRFFYNFYNFAGFQALGHPAVLAVHDSFPEDEVHLIASDQGSQVEVTAHWNERLFSDLTLPDRLLALVRQAVEGAATLGDLDVMLSSELRTLAGWNDTAVNYREIHNLQLLLEEQARRTPDAVAVTCEGESLTYRELHRRANRLAHWLRGEGVGPETVVATAVERSCEMAVALLGILKAGGAYVPLDPDYPEERLRYMLADSGAAVLLLGRRAVPGLDGFAGPILRVSAEAVELARQPETDLPCATTGESLAYVIYTSGSTGRPKGAMNTHRAIVNRLLWMQQEYGLTAADRVLQKTPLSFDVSVWEVFWPLLTGARLVVARPEGHKDAAYLARLIREQEVTTLHFVPSMLRIFLEEKSAAACASIRRVICSGEALPHDLQERFFARLDTAELHNLYGPTEAAVDVTYWACLRDGGRPVVPIGRPVANTRIHLLDREMRPVPAGIAGELYIGGVQPARGYLGRPELTADRFVPDPFAPDGGGRLYRTGDLARHLPDGAIEYLGRIDHQVKLRGIRIELGEIEAVLARVPAVRETLALVREDAPGGEDAPGDKTLVAYLVPEDTAAPRPGHAELARHARQSLPEAMVPAHFVWLDAMPLLPNGKADRRSLPAPEAARPELSVAFAAARSATEQAVVSLWQEVLRVANAGAEDNFFDLGGHSLLLVRVQARVRERFGRDLSMVELFRHPTARSLAAYLDELAAPPAAPETREPAPAVPPQPERRGSAVAVVGLAGRFPGAGSPEELWEKLRAGSELITFFSREELAAAGVEGDLLDRPDYVPARARLADIDKFDAAFFGLSPREAEILDPQHRLFLEASWEALESAGYDPQRAGRVGVFAGQSVNTYLLFHLAANPRVMNAVGFFQAVLGNDKDYLATRTSYKLGLKGPSLTVQTACSTSLSAVHLACRSLLDGECDMALAGGVSVSVPAETGYLYQQGSIVSPDGHCRAFDARAQGTVPGNGLGLVVLKRLDDAVRDGDTIRAVILGSAMNNDGADKVGYTAPSVDGQVDVLTSALARAGVGAETIGYVEAHGTGTPLGDPIEVAALKQVFPADLAPGSVALGSVKTNLGHLDAAAGVTGLIKAVLALENGEIPPSLHFEAPNPELGLEGSPFRVNAGAEAWPRGATPRRAGVSSFGIGGTNVHVVLEEAPAVTAADRVAERPYVLPLSARTETALEVAAARLADHLRQHPEQSLADVAWTLQAGRRAFPHRRVVVARTADEAVEALSGREPGRVRSRFEDGSGRPVAFLFPGQGAQHPGMAAGLYADEPSFRERVDRCAEILVPHLGLDLRGLLFPEPGREDEARRLLDRTRFTQPALFTVELALAGMWMDRGLRPAAFLGHSIGELVAATLAGVFELPDALALVALRGRLMDELPGGAMLSVPLPEAEVAPLLGPGLSLAAVNGPALAVVAGAEEAVEDLARRLAERGVACRRLHTSHAFHSESMEPAVAPFTEAVSRVPRKEPRIPFLSGTTGTWITPQQATDPAYWGRHLREPIRFADGLATLAGSLGGVLLEVGPGNALATMARRQLGEGTAVLTSLPHPRERAADREAVAEALGQLWLHGVPVDWAALRNGARRVPLPTYPFERRRYWIEAQGIGAHARPPAPVEDRVANTPEKTEERSVAALPAHRSTARSRPYAPPETEVERGIAALWEEVLGVEAVGRADEFFELGGHSLMGIQLAARLQERFPVKVAVDDLFDQPTVAGLAELVEARLLDYLDNLSDHEAASWLASTAAGG